VDEEPNRIPEVGRRTSDTGHATVHRMPPFAVQARRLPALVLGLVLFGVGSGMSVQSAQGLSPWHIFHEGIAERTPLTIGTAVILTGAIVLIATVALREPIGIGTVLNVLMIGPSLDLTIRIIGDPSSVGVRIALAIAGPAVVAIGSGFYLGVRLGPGPRDGLMTAMARRGVTIWKARTGIETTVMVVGVLLGGTLGWGTLWFLVSIGPMVQIALRFLSARRHPSEASASYYTPKHST